MAHENEAIKQRIARIRHLCDQDGSEDYYQAGSLACAIVHDTLGGNHPVMGELRDSLKAADWQRVRSASRSVVALFEHGALSSPRLAIAHELEGELLDIAQVQAELAEVAKEVSNRQVHLALIRQSYAADARARSRPS